jgi:hypothetical protein
MASKLLAHRLSQWFASETALSPQDPSLDLDREVKRRKKMIDLLASYKRIQRRLLNTSCWWILLGMMWGESQYLEANTLKN